MPGIGNPQIHTVIPELFTDSSSVVQETVTRQVMNTP